MSVLSQGDRRKERCLHVPYNFLSMVNQIWLHSFTVTLVTEVLSLLSNCNIMALSHFSLLVTRWGWQVLTIGRDSYLRTWSERIVAKAGKAGCLWFGNADKSAHWGISTAFPETHLEGMDCSLERAVVQWEEVRLILTSGSSLWLKYTWSSYS